MNFARYFKASSYLLIGMGFVSVAATRRVHPAIMLLFAAAFIASWHMNTAHFRQRVPKWIFNCLGLVYIPFFLWDARFLSHSFVIAAVHLLIFASAVKLLTIFRDRDYLQLYLISFVEVLAASTITVNLIFGICLLAFLASGVNTMVLFEMRRSNARMPGVAKVQPFVRTGSMQETGLELFSQFPSRLFFLSTIGMTALILSAAVPLFLLMPRVTTGFYSRPSGSTRFVSGFSDHVELGQIGSIQQSDAVVMRVQTATALSEIPENLKWRGLAFDYFDGRSWKNTDPHRLTIPTQGRYYKLENYAQGTQWLNQTFFVEALSTNVIFAANRPLAISQDVGSLWRDSSGNLYTGSHIRKKLRYAVISDTLRPDPGSVPDSVSFPQEIVKKYLQVPEEDSRILDLANRVTAKSNGKYFKALDLERYLRSHYGYSLVLRGAPNSKDPLAMFLFDIRAGHCEYFASSMAIMLRQLGIPARLVNGFRAGEYNSIGNNWTVRQYHAHSWVEAYFPPYGWVDFDPTPAGPEPSRHGLVGLIADLSDAIDLWWWEGVLNYDSSKQYSLLSVLQAALEKGRYSIESAFARLYEKGVAYTAAGQKGDTASILNKGWIICAALVFLLFLMLIRRWRRLIFGRIKRVWHHKNARTVAASFFAEALDLLHDRGYRLSPGQTPLEFADSLKGKPPGEPLSILTHIYYRVRFGPEEISFSSREAQIQLRLLRHSLRKT